MEYLFGLVWVSLHFLFLLKVNSFSNSPVWLHTTCSSQSHQQLPCCETQGPRRCLLSTCHHTLLLGTTPDNLAPTLHLPDFLALIYYSLQIPYLLYLRSHIVQKSYSRLMPSSHWHWYFERSWWLLVFLPGVTRSMVWCHQLRWRKKGEEMVWQKREVQFGICSIWLPCRTSPWKYTEGVGTST